VAHSIFESVLFGSTAELARAVGTERVAQLGHHNRIFLVDSLAGVVERVLASGNGLHQSRLNLRGDTAEPLPEKDGSLISLLGAREKQGVSRLSQVFEKFSRLIVESREHLIQSLVPQMPVDSLAKHAAEVCCDCQVSSFIEL
jgi:hypothetical protein